jgi:6-phosphogluconolactonase
VKGKLFVFDTAEEVAGAGAAKTFTYLDAALQGGGTASLALAGGKTPRNVYEDLATHDISRNIQWSRVHVFWADERCVPATRPESHFRMVQEAFLKRVPLPPQNIHRMAGDHPPAAAAQEYEQDLRKFFDVANRNVPRFTVILLGLGTDGHVASLYPGSRGFHETNKLVMAEEMPGGLAGSCLSMTLPVINNAGAVLVFVTGKEKAPIVREILAGQMPNLPGQMLDPTSGDLCWFVDKEAASLLPPS